MESIVSNHSEMFGWAKSVSCHIAAWLAAQETTQGWRKSEIPC
jgi:hypothetical protein